VVVFEPEPEQRERFDRRPTADDHLGTSLGQQVERRELLEHAHRVGGAQHRDRTGQTDLPGARRRRRENQRRRRIEIVLAVMLADSKHVESDLIGALDLLDELAYAVGRTYATALLEVGRCETIDTNLHIPHAPDEKS